MSKSNRYAKQVKIKLKQEMSEEEKKRLVYHLESMLRRNSNGDVEKVTN